MSDSQPKIDRRTMAQQLTLTEAERLAISAVVHQNYYMPDVFAAVEQVIAQRSTPVGHDVESLVARLERARRTPTTTQDSKGGWLLREATPDEFIERAERIVAARVQEAEAERDTLRERVEALAVLYVAGADAYVNSHLVQRAIDLRRHADDLRHAVDGTL